MIKGCKYILKVKTKMQRGKSDFTELHSNIKPDLYKIYFQFNQSGMTTFIF